MRRSTQSRRSPVRYTDRSEDQLWSFEAFICHRVVEEELEMLVRWSTGEVSFTHWQNIEFSPSTTRMWHEYWATYTSQVAETARVRSIYAACARDVYARVHELDWRERSVKCLKKNWKVLLIIAFVGSVSTIALMGLLIASFPVCKNSKTRITCLIISRKNLSRRQQDHRQRQQQAYFRLK